MSNPDDVTRAEGLLEARAAHQRNQTALAQGLPKAQKLAKSRARNGTTGFALIKGAPRAVRHLPGVAEMLWDIAELIQRDAESQVTADTGSTDTHFRTDGNPAPDGNRRGSYRTSVRTYTHASVRAQHEDHLLEAALSAAKSKGL